MALATVTAGVGAASKVLGGTVAIGAQAMSGESGSEGRIEYIVSRLFRPEAGGTNGPAAAGASGENGSENREAIRDGVLLTLRNIGLDGELSDEDKRYIAQVVAQETGLSQDAARARVEGYLSSALMEMRQAAEAARKAGIIAAFLTAATLLVSAIAGWWAAGVGGRHRDEGIDLGVWFRTR
ncbi:MAG: hypothetical protein GEU76_01535 [Alphaproteobacteria bacterium]|nr:hypothetical protein [Alphaproteobacteria bacterium]